MMNQTYLRKMFTQTVAWGEVSPAASSLDAETTTNHRLQYVRISARKDGRTLDDSGERTASTATLYVLAKYSTCDDSFTLPAIKDGDEITTADSRTMIVEGVKTCYGIGGSVHHLEVTIR